MLSATAIIRCQRPICSFRAHVLIAFIAFSGLSALQQLGASTVVDLKIEGAKGDGVTDDQAQIVAAITKAKLLGQPLYAPPGTYVHSGVITLNGVQMFGAGDTTVFSAKNAPQGSFTLTGASPSLKALKTIRNPIPTVRTSAGPTIGVFITTATDFTVDNVTIDNPSGAGMLTASSHGTASNYATISNCRVNDSLADAFHITNGSYYIKEIGNTATNPGDDMFAVVSYLSNGTACHDILITGNTGVWNKTGGPNDSARGLSCVGGNSVTYSNNSVTGTNAAGIYIASESAYNTYGSDNIVVSGNTVTNACLTANTGHAGILVYARTGYPINNVTLDNNRIVNSGYQGINTRTFVTLVKISNNTIDTTGSGITSSQPGIKIAGTQDVEISNNTITNTGSHGILVDNAATGYCKILANDFSKINYNTTNSADGINIASGAALTSLIITDNTMHTNPPGWSISSFVNINGFTGATVTNNQTISSTPTPTPTPSPTTAPPLPPTNLTLNP